MNGTDRSGKPLRLYVNIVVLVFLMAINLSVVQVFAAFVRQDQTSDASVNIYPVYYEDSKFAPNSNMNAFRLIDNAASLQEGDSLPACDNLFGTQFSCELPPISNQTYEFEGCRPNNTVPVLCTVREGVNCTGSPIFYKQTSCFYTYVECCAI